MIKYRKIQHSLYITAMAIVMLSGCANVKNSLGLEKESPDEFAVVTRAPLEIPSTLTLPPPIPGMARPQEKSAIDSATEAVLGHKTQKDQRSSTAESALLMKANAGSTNSNIRTIVNNETKELYDRNKPVAEKLLNIGGNKDEPSATVVDPVKEIERIKKNKEEGKSILDGETPVIEE